MLHLPPPPTPLWHFDPIPDYDLPLRDLVITLRLTTLLWQVVTPTQKPQLHNTQHSQETDIHDPGGIRTPNPSNRAAADPRLRHHDHWDRCVTSYNSHELQIRFYKFSEMRLAV